MPALQKASNSPELEVAKRAQLLVQKITEKASPEFLKLKAEDTVQTQDFQIVGRITSTTVFVTASSVVSSERLCANEREIS